MAKYNPVVNRSHVSSWFCVVICSIVVQDSYALSGIPDNSIVGLHFVDELTYTSMPSTNLNW